MRKILSIDGGGIRGIIPALILAEIEKRTKKPISEMFDIIAGTSTGGIIALGLTKPNSKGKPAYKAKDLVKLYETEGQNIFFQPIWIKLFDLLGLFNAKYPSAGIETVLKHYFKDTHLKHALTNVVIPSYDIEHRDAFFFKSHKAQFDPARNFLMRDVARATSAAPTYFQPKKLFIPTTTDYQAAIDGGVFANNPAMCAYVEAQKLYPQEKDFLIVSLGTGTFTKPLYYNDVKTWGLAKWAKPILDTVFDGVSDTVDYQLRTLLPLSNEGKRKYYRFQVRLDEENDAMDNVTEINLRTLKLLAENEIRDQEEILNVLCKNLTSK
jgi:uncharacterized protein